ncbi:hypothetical protein FLA105534_03446 [Flavobacterium bizetiae]|uniref:Uncharacterized protein n=1 Tax=Flavobacterium bizetiae TaxID=2704140 RepID=A0A6J4GPI2_9FLAO|nr:hypothetical protein FLA105534_03446 [Flavobacterium bizetiae]CAD5343733.1 hypothetical protein FLA105535_03734 [Flavobacterium bizetiae]CAD5349895.1 hypothetical protein FLA105534_03882 [Flavobacterium bizetiae]
MQWSQSWSQVYIIKMQSSQSFTIENCDFDFFYCKDKKLKTATATENYFLVLAVAFVVLVLAAGFFLS